MFHYFGRLLSQTDRILAFDRAIRKVVTTDDVVVDLGCGLGTFAMLAARAGARRVFGVDFDPVIELARQVAECNQASVEFVTGEAREVDLPEQATILIFEDFSTAILDGPVRETLDNVRNRWMTEQYRIIPERVSLNLAPVQCASARREALPVERLGERPFGLDFQPLKESDRRSMNWIRSPADTVLLAPASVVFEHALTESLPSRWSTDGVFELVGDGEFDGLFLWFDMFLDDVELYSNNPASTATWGQAYFPTPERWSVRSGERLQFKLRFESTPIGDVWKWSFELLGVNGETRNRWSANTFAASSVTAQSLQRYRMDDVVHLSPRGRHEALILSLADGQRTLEEICARVQEQCDLADRQTALALVLRTLKNKRV